MRKLVTTIAVLGGFGAAAMGQVPAWWRDFNAGGGIAEQAISIGVDANGNVYSAGTTGSSPNTDILVVSYSPTGAWRWTAIYNGPGNKDDRPIEIAVDTNGDVYLVGMAYDNATTNAMVTQKYDGATGVLQWSRPHYYDDGFFGLMPCVGRGIALGPAGTVYACGSAAVFNEFEDAYVSSQNRTDGVITNTHVFGTNLAPAANQVATDIVFNGVDGVFVTGPTAGNQLPYSSDQSDLFVRRLNTTLGHVWTNTFDGYGKADTARNVAVRHNDVFVFGNATTNPATYPVLFLVKADATTGAEVWRKLRGTASDIETGRMVLSSFGDPTIIGNIDQFSGMALRYRGTDGYLYWERVFTDHQYSDLAIDSAAATYLVGPTTMKLSHTGTTLWNSPESGGAAAVGPGNVLYTNRTQFNATADLRTIRWFQAAYALTLAPSSTVGGVNVTATLKSNLVAPAGGLTFTISENSIYAATVQGATIPAGATQTNFIVLTAPNKGWTNVLVPINATMNGVTLTATLTILPPVPQSLVMSPNVVQAGFNSTGTVTLTGKAPAAGLWVALSDNSPAVATPIAVKVLAGQTAAQFVVQTTDVAVATVVTISAKSNGVTRTATLTVNP